MTPDVILERLEEEPEEMRAEYDFSRATPNPYVKRSWWHRVFAWFREFWQHP